MPAELPGFYFDEEKGKYFRIQAHHKAPAGAKYTKNAIRMENENRRRRLQAEQEQEWFKSWAPIQRNAALRSSGSGYLLTRNLGVQPTVSRAKLLSDNLEVTNVAVKDEYGGVLGPTVSMVWDAELEELISLTLGSYSRGQISPPRLIKHTLSDELSEHHDLHGSIISTMCMTHGRTIVIGGQDIVWLFNGADLSLSSNVFQTSISLNSSRAHPRDHGRALLGGTHELLFFNFDHGLHRAGPHAQRAKAMKGSEILDVSWLGDQVALSGHRDGRIVLSDPRSRPGDAGSAGSVLRLQAASGVHSIHGIAGHKVLAAGLLDSLEMFDLRFSKKLPANKDDKSKPLISYPGYVNRGFADLPVAVNEDWNIAAAANATGGIQTFDLHTGHQLGHGLRSDDPRSMGNRATALCFSELQGETTPRLFAGKSGLVEAWA